MAQFNPGIEIASVDGNNNVRRVADMFVNDCDLWTALPTPESDADLVQTFSKAAQAWERVLFASGGLLALHKGYRWLIAWDWNQGLPVCRNLGLNEYEVEL